MYRRNCLPDINPLDIFRHCSIFGMVKSSMKKRPELAMRQMEVTFNITFEWSTPFVPSFPNKFSSIYYIKNTFYRNYST